MMKKLIIFLLLAFTLQANAQIITTVAGDGFGSGSVSGDGGQATNAELSFINGGIALDVFNNIYIPDENNNVIRKVNSLGIITTIAGNRTLGYSGDGGQATDAELNDPEAVAVDAVGNIYIVDADNACIRMINTSGIIMTIAGKGPNSSGGIGDGGQATDAVLSGLSGIAIDVIGNLYISDDNRIRKINTLGIITTIVGNGVVGFGGDGGQATNAKLEAPYGIAFDQAGNLYFADSANDRVRKINSSGIITTVAGNGFNSPGTGGFSGDGGQATNAELYYPTGIILDAAGNLYIADLFNERVRMVSTSGIITTIAGDGTQAYSGDGAAATAAELGNPAGLAFDTESNLYIADSYNNRIRKITNVAQAASIQQLSINNVQVNIYPNPSSGNFIIAGATNLDYVKVTDMIGQTVYEAKPNNENTILQINNAGVYFVTITSGKDVSTKKIIVNN
jgi:hypothetical protein